jgi:hypothetical protein
MLGSDFFLRELDADDEACEPSSCSVEGSSKINGDRPLKIPETYYGFMKAYGFTTGSKEETTKITPLNYNTPIIIQAHQKGQNIYKALRSSHTPLQSDENDILGSGSAGKVYGVVGDKTLAIKRIYSDAKAQDCRTTKECKIVYWDGRGQCIVPIGSYIPEIFVGAQTEIIVHAYATELVRTGITNHVLPLLSIFYLSSSQNLVMPRMEMTLNDLLCEEDSAVSESSPIAHTINTIFFQALFGLACLQEHFKIVHNDIGWCNLFLRQLPARENFVYAIGDRRLILPHCQYFSALGDFNCSVMWKGRLTGPCVALIIPVVHDDGTPLLPNWYCPAYDVLSLVSMFYIEGDHTPWLLDLCTRLYGCSESEIVSAIEKTHQKTELANGHTGTGYRVKIDLLRDKFGDVSASEILRGEGAFADWLFSPDSPLQPDDGVSKCFMGRL